MLGGYYRFFPGDYLRDTSGLSLVEHGAYNLLLHHYYSSDGDVVDEKPRLYRLCGATTSEEQAAVDYILKRYFPSCSGKLKNNRADRELDGRRKFLEEQSRKGKLGGRPRKKPDESRGKAGAKAAGKAGAKPNESPPAPAPAPVPDPKPLPEPDPGTSVNTLSGKKAPDDVSNGIPYVEIIGYLNERAEKNFNPKTESARKHIRARWSEGARTEHFKIAIDNQVRVWKGTKNEIYLRPTTLFNSEKFDGYVNNTGSVEPKGWAAIREWRRQGDERDQRIV